MKKLKRGLIITLLMLMTLSFSACGSKEEDNDQASQRPQINADELIGKWKGTGGEVSTLTLGKDGSYKDDAGDVSVIGTYSFDQASGTMTVNESEYGLVFSYSVDLSENKLTLQMNGGNPRTFTKQ